MDKYLFTSVDVVAKHEPDYTTVVDQDGINQRSELPGFVTVGVLIGGKFMPFARFHGGDLTDEIETAKAAAAAAPPPPPAV
jgi:hypothetical protein